MKQLIFICLVISLAFQLGACSRKQKETSLEQSTIVQRKIAQKVSPLEPTFKPERAIVPKQAKPITIPPIGG